MYKKHLLATVLLVTLTGLNLKAQENIKLSIEERAEVRSKIMQQELGLDSVQYQNVLILNTQDAKKISLIKTSTGSPVIKARQTLRLKQDRENEIKKILSSEQYKIYQKMKSESVDVL